MGFACGKFLMSAVAALALSACASGFEPSPAQEPLAREMLKRFPQVEPAQFMRDFNTICIDNTRSALHVNRALKQEGYFLVHSSRGVALFGIAKDRAVIKSRQIHNGRSGQRCEVMAQETPELRAFVAKSLKSDPRYVQTDGSWFATDTAAVTTLHSPVPSGGRVFSLMAVRKP